MDRALCLYHVCSVKSHLRMRDPGPSAGLNYEQQILELEQKLVQRQNPEGAAPPPCPPSGGGEQQGVTEAQRSVELALQEQIQSLQQQLSMKVLHTPSSNVPPWI